jgi:hypothetical protein
VDFEYDKTFLKSIVSDFFHFVLSVFIVSENHFEKKFFVLNHHKVAGGVESSENRKKGAEKNLRVFIIRQAVCDFKVLVSFPI